MAARKMISTGSVTKSSVIITSFGLGPGIDLPSTLLADVGVMESAAA